MSQPQRQQFNQQWKNVIRLISKAKDEIKLVMNIAELLFILVSGAQISVPMKY